MVPFCSLEIRTVDEKTFDRSTIHFQATFSPFQSVKYLLFPIPAARPRHLFHICTDQSVHYVFRVFQALSDVRATLRIEEREITYQQV